MANPANLLGVGVVYPVRGGTALGYPGSGTHSFTDAPNNWESDEAIDIGVPIGTPVYAVASGTIGSQFGYLTDSASSRFAGLRLHLDTADDEFYYAHLSRFAPGIRPGAQVEKGQLLGYSGSASGVEHLHFAERAGYPSSGTGAPVSRFLPGASGRGVTPSLPPQQAASTSVNGDGAAGTAPSGSCFDAVEAYKRGEISAADLLAKGCPTSLGPTGVGVIDAPIETVTGAIDSTKKAIEFLFSIRFLEIVSGGLLILLGLFLLGRQLGVSPPVAIR